MELSEKMNELMGSNLFSVLMIIAVLAIGFVLRLTFRTPDQSGKEYKYNPNDWD